MTKRIEEHLGLPSNTHYSISFKIKVVKEVESGILTKEEAKRKYGIKGNSAVLNWCRQYGKFEHMAKKNKRLTEGEESIELLKLRSEKAKLEALLVKAEMKVMSLETVIEIANEMYDTDLKKKLGTKL